MTTYSGPLTREIIGHAKMCVRMKLRKDERNGRTHTPSVQARIDRGRQTLEWLKQLENEDDAERQRNLLHP